jgi:hypothetical protein
VARVKEQEIPFDSILTTWICYYSHWSVRPGSYISAPVHKGGHVFKRLLLTRKKEKANDKR